MSSVFLDTGFVLALELRGDRNHASARRIWSDVAGLGASLVTTTYVFGEVVTFLSSRGRHDRAVDVGERLQRSRHVELVHVDEGLFLRAWEVFRSRQDKSYSLTDCVSFVVMRERSLTRALGFDRHFTQEGFILVD